MWSTRKRNSGSRLGHDKRDIPAFDTVSLNSNLGSPGRNYFSIITTDINVLHFGSITSKRLLKLHHWWLKNKERKVDFRFVERKFLAAINLTGSAEGALVPVLLRITHWTKSGLPVSPPGLFPPCFNPRHFALGHLDQNLALPPFNFIQRPSGFINRNAKKYTHLDTNHFQSMKICKEGLTLQFNNRSLAQVAGQTMEAHYNA